MPKIIVNTTQKANPEYYRETRLEKINLDKERIKDLVTGQGFIITAGQSMKKEFRNRESIYSSLYGPSLQDPNPDRYRCSCGHVKGKLNLGVECPVCKTECKFIGDNFAFFGWIILKDYCVIHPTCYKQLESLIKADKLINILKIDDKKDENGFSTDDKVVKKDEPFYGIGMTEFQRRFLEIIEYYARSKPQKQDLYYDLVKDYNDGIVFTHSVPVFTTLLRPFKIDGDNFTFEQTNAMFNLMARLSLKINQDKYEFDRKTKPKNLLLFDFQNSWMTNYTEIINIMAQKKGRFRSSYGGRCNFSARSVIVSNSIIRIDEVRLSYKALAELLQQKIINVLKKSFNITYSSAYVRWKKSIIKRDDTIYNIIENIIAAQPGGRGLPILINRNPTIAYGGFLYMNCVGIQEDSYTMALPLQVLPLLAADFDGDTLNIFLLINDMFRDASENVFSPRYCMYISRNHGYFNNDVNIADTTVINIDTFIEMSRPNYSADQLAQIERLRQL